ncbi:MAG: PaaI family thioesterase [Reyranellaceae bacterium]
MTACFDPALAEPPPGFHPLRNAGNFNQHAGPFFYRVDRGRFVTGFRIMAHHLNPVGVMHGGMSVAFADMSLGLGMAVKCGLPIFSPTVNLTADFLTGGRPGAWVESDVKVIRRTRSMLFGEALLTADGAPFLRASGVMKIPASNAMGFEFDALFPELKTAGYVPEYGDEK